MPVESTTKWIEEEIIPRVVLKNFKEATVKEIRVRALETMKDNWASDMFEIDLLLNNRCKEHTVSLLMKTTSEHEIVKQYMLSEKRFFNEIHFYSTICQFFTARINSKELKEEFENTYPVCYYSFYRQDKKPENVDDAFLLLENLKVRDFKLGNRHSLDFNHCSLAFKYIGRFHAFSYFMKERDLTNFMDIVVEPLRETTFDQQGEDHYNTVFHDSQYRVINALAKELSDIDPGLSKLRSLGARKVFDTFKDFVVPQEPLAVLCHGDFLRNNVLFRYENGEPVEMKLIDFQTMRYASPAIDLSLFLWMNTTHELRKVHFYELLHTYHATVVDTLAILLGKPKEELDEKYSFEYFLTDFRRHATYGYMITVGFLPWMFAESDEFSEFMKIHMDEIGSPKYREMQQKLGGETATRTLVLAAKDLLEYECI